MCTMEEVGRASGVMVCSYSRLPRRSGLSLVSPMLEHEAINSQL